MSAQAAPAAMLVSTAVEPITLATVVEPMLHILERTTAALEGTKREYLIPSLAQAADAIQDAILRDERGPARSKGPEFEPEVLASMPAELPSYVEKAIQAELTKLFNAPEAAAKIALDNAAFQVARWAAGRYLTDRDGQRAVWKVAESQNHINTIGRDAAEQIIKAAWLRGHRKRRSIPNVGNTK